jgi:hypothetical protein
MNYNVLGEILELGSDNVRKKMEGFKKVELYFVVFQIL